MFCAHRLYTVYWGKKNERYSGMLGRTSGNDGDECWRNGTVTVTHLGKEINVSQECTVCMEWRCECDNRDRTTTMMGVEAQVGLARSIDQLEAAVRSAEKYRCLWEVFVLGFNLSQLFSHPRMCQFRPKNFILFQVMCSSSRAEV